MSFFALASWIRPNARNSNEPRFSSQVTLGREVGNIVLSLAVDISQAVQALSSRTMGDFIHMIRTEHSRLADPEDSD